MFTRLYTFIPQQACSLFEPFQLPGEHATLAAILALLGSSNHITNLPFIICQVPYSQLGELRQCKVNCLAQEQTKVTRLAIEPVTL